MKDVKGYLLNQLKQPKILQAAKNHYLVEVWRG